MEKVWAKVNGNYEFADASKMGNSVEAINFLVGAPYEIMFVSDNYYYDTSYSKRSAIHQAATLQAGSQDSSDKMHLSQWGSSDVKEAILDATENGYPLVAVYVNTTCDKNWNC
jgi:hypothetical protein